MPVDEIPIWKKVKTTLVAKWSQEEEEQLRDLNLRTNTDPNIIRIGTTVPDSLLLEAEE
jgi:hypothetical protein